MSEVYDNWHWLVRAVLGDEDLERSSLWTLSDVSSASFSSSFSHSFSSSSPQLQQVNIIPDNKNKKPGVVLFLGGLLARSWRLGRIGDKKYDFFELYPRGFFNLNQLKAATNDFDPAKRIGGVGNVYRGELDGILVAVKRLSARSKEGAQEFINAVGVISVLKHPNLATLMGSCTEQNQLLLVYKYMENVSLQHALFGPEKSNQN